MKKTVLALAASAAFFAAQAHAEITVNDTDGNGSYSMEELSAAVEGLTAEVFAEIDTDASGEVSVEELAAAVEAGVIEG